MFIIIELLTFCYTFLSIFIFPSRFFVQMLFKLLAVLIEIFYRKTLIICNTLSFCKLFEF